MLKARKFQALFTGIISVFLLSFGGIPTIAQGNSTYVVQQGDSLRTIAVDFCTTWSDIYNANRGLIGNNPNLLYIGIPLSITNRCGTEEAVAGEQVVNPSATGVFDRGVRTYATGTVVDGNRYIVAWGDTVFSIALRFGLTADQLWDANEGMSNLGLYAGTRILIPNYGEVQDIGSGMGTDDIQPGTATSQPGTSIDCTLTSSSGSFEAYSNPGDGEVAALIETNTQTGEAKMLSGGLTWYRVTYLETYLWIADTNSITTSGDC